MAFRFAFRAGPGDPLIRESQISGSAFSKGDLVQVIGSSVSAMAPLLGATDIYGIALADSNQSNLDGSGNRVVPVMHPGPDDVFLSTLTPTGSLITEGTEVDVETDSRTRANYCAVSANTVRLVMYGTPLDQSGESKVFVKFIYHAGNVDLA